MTFEVYSFLLCLITFTLLTGVFTVTVAWLVQLKFKVLELGAEDEKIKKEYLKSLEKKPSIIGKVFDCFVLFVCCLPIMVTNLSRLRSPYLPAPK